MRPAPQPRGIQIFGCPSQPLWSAGSPAFCLVRPYHTVSAPLPQQMGQMDQEGSGRSVLCARGMVLMQGQRTDASLARLPCILNVLKNGPILPTPLKCANMFLMIGCMEKLAVDFPDVLLYCSCCDMRVNVKNAPARAVVTSKIHKSGTRGSPEEMDPSFCSQDEGLTESYRDFDSRPV